MQTTTSHHYARIVYNAPNGAPLRIVTWDPGYVVQAGGDLGWEPVSMVFRELPTAKKILNAYLAEADDGE